MPWLLKTLQKDIFGGAENISKGHFMQIRGDSPDKNAFWRSVSQIAIEKFNMQEVFNMESSVRLTAIEKLGRVHSPHTQPHCERVSGDVTIVQVLGRWVLAFAHSLRWII